MQNWRIKRMSVQELIAQLKAVGSLLYLYQKGRCYQEDCPLCEAADEYHPRSSTTCNYCLWKIIEGEDCCDFSLREFGRNAGVLIGQKRWHKARIPMLKRWKKILKAERVRRVR